MYEHKTLFLVIETTGLARKRVPGKKPGTTKNQNLDYATEYMEFPYIVEIAWAINQEEVRRYILNQESREVPIEASDIHGVTTEIANKSEHTFVQAINKLILDSVGCEIVVGHGLYFDTSIIKANVLREIDKKMLEKETFDVFTDILHKYKRIDTMRSTAKMMGKWPTLSELYMKLFRKGFKAHSAKEDVEATRRCYEWLVKKGIVPTWEELQEKAREKELLAVDK